jgi:NADPH-dependent ferric siderophore reductase
MSTTADLDRDVRAALDETIVTRIERERREQAAIPTFHTSVVAVSPINAGLIEVDLAGGLDEFATLGGDEFFYMMMPRPGADPIPDDYTMAAYMAQAVDERPMGAYYTVRRWDPDRRRITIWVVMHGHDAGVGRWFEHCGVGDRVVIWGPRHSFSPPVEAREQLLVADETGFAAVVALLAETPPGRPSTVVLETIDEQHTIDLSGFPDATVRWLFRGDAEPGTGDALLRAVRDIDLDAAGLVAFGAAESRQITAVRRHLRDDVGMPAASVFMTGYWRRADD